jgi:hypothetical protein
MTTKERICERCLETIGPRCQHITWYDESGTEHKRHAIDCIAGQAVEFEFQHPDGTIEAKQFLFSETDSYDVTTHCAPHGTLNCQYCKAALTHGTNCPASIPLHDEDCTCGLEYRIQLQTIV